MRALKRVHCLSFLFFITSENGKSGSHPASVCPVQVIIGTPPAQAEVCPLSWRLGSCYLYEEVLPAPAVFFMYVMGRAYRGLFQDPNMIRFIPQEACGGGNLAILEALDIEQQSSSIVQRGEGSVRAAAGLIKTEGNGIMWDMEKFANIAQFSGRKLIFAFDGTFSNASISTAAVTMVNLVDSISASASLSGGTFSNPHSVNRFLTSWQVMRLWMFYGSEKFSGFLELCFLEHLVFTN